MGDDDGHSLLHWGALVGNSMFCKVALAKGNPVDALANNQQTPLMWAVLKNHIQTARVLIDAKAELQAHDSLGATPLMIAIQHKNYHSVLLLMSRGKDKIVLDTDGMDAHRSIGLPTRVTPRL